VERKPGCHGLSVVGAWFDARQSVARHAGLWSVTGRISVTSVKHEIGNAQPRRGHHKAGRDRHEKEGLAMTATTALRARLASRRRRRHGPPANGLLAAGAAARRPPRTVSRRPSVAVRGAGVFDGLSPVAVA
jgi:hypothetical protein